MSTQDPSAYHHREHPTPSELHSVSHHGEFHRPLISYPASSHEAAKWKQAAHVHIENTRYLPSLELSNSYHHRGIEGAIERSKAMVAFGKSNEMKLAAAHALWSYGLSEFNVQDRHGANRHFKLENLHQERVQPGSAPPGSLRILENNHVIAQDNPQAPEHLQYMPRHMRPPHVEGFHKNFFGSGGRYHQPRWADGQERRIYSENVDPHYYGISQNPDGSRTVDFYHGCAVDTDGSSYHPEDRDWRPDTNLHNLNGKPLNTDKQNYVVLSPSLARSLGVRIGDLGYLVDKNTGHAVPVVFGDKGPEGKRSAEASVHALKQLGYGRIDGNHGVEGHFQIVLVPHSGNGRGDISNDGGAGIVTALNQRSKTPVVERT